MTARAQLTQADMTRATKAVAAAGLSCACIVMDFANRQIKVMVGEPAKAETQAATTDLTEEWTDDDV